MIHKFMPARAEVEEPIKILSDFDALIAQKVGFKFHGKVYVLNAVNVENFMSMTLAYQELLKMVGDRSQPTSIEDNEIYEKYFNLINPIVPDFSYADLRSLPVVLLNNLVNLVLRQLAGDPKLYENQDSSQKKNP